MEPITFAIMAAGAVTCIAALVKAFKESKTTDVKVKIGDIEISVKGPLSDSEAKEIVQVINRTVRPGLAWHGGHKQGEAER